MHPRAIAVISEVSEQYNVSPALLTGILGHRKPSLVTAARDAVIVRLWDRKTRSKRGNYVGFKWSVAEVARQLSMHPENVREALIRTGVYHSMEAAE